MAIAFTAPKTVRTQATPKRSAGDIPAQPRRKKLLTLRLDVAIIEKFRETGPGWQTRMAEALRDYAV